MLLKEEKIELTAFAILSFQLLLLLLLANLVYYILRSEDKYVKRQNKRHTCWVSPGNTSNGC
jgi:hypothetical protein